eukprot:12413440-Karenia_brevis.AAC.1
MIADNLCIGSGINRRQDPRSDARFDKNFTCHECKVKEEESDVRFLSICKDWKREQNCGKKNEYSSK